MLISKNAYFCLQIKCTSINEVSMFSLQMAIKMQSLCKNIRLDFSRMHSSKENKDLMMI